MQRRSVTALFFALLAGLGAILKLWGHIVDLFNLSEDTKAMLASVQKIVADWGIFIFLIVLIGLALTFAIPAISRRKGLFQKAVKTEGEGISSGPVLPEVGTKAPQLDRQPINQAYEYLVGLRVVQEDGNEPMQIAGLLRQAALDGEIMIWGSESSSAPVEWQAPILLEINRGYWRHHGIDPVRLMIDASELPDEGCKTQRESPPWNDQTECYWHLHVDMSQVGSIWREQMRPDNATHPLRRHACAGLYIHWEL